MLDTRIFTVFGGIFGLASPLKGEHLLLQAKRNNNLNEAIITIDGNSNLVTFGAMYTEKCGNWALIRPLTTNQWVFMTDEIELMDERVNGLKTV